MKAVLATPNFHQPRGNTVTVQRIADKLGNLGVSTKIVSITDHHPVPSIPEADVIHGFNAYRLFRYKQQLEQPIGSYVVTMTGTDLNHDLFTAEKRGDVIQSVTEAKAVHVFNTDAKEILVREIPSIADKIFIIPQAVSSFEERETPFSKEADTFLFILPAGIRKVKNIPFAIQSLARLQVSHPHIRLLIVGPVIEDAEAELVKNLTEEHSSWVRYLGQVPHDRMGSLYKQADAMLNTSISEGQSTAIMEAMSYGLPVLVSHNQGNLSIVKHGQTGFVYNGQAEFLDYAQKMVNNNEISRTMGEAASSYIEKNHSETAEAEAILKMYRFALNL